MYPITSAVKALFEAEQRKVLRITGTDKNGEPIILTDKTIMRNGFSIDRFSSTGERLEIGTAVSAELTLKLNNVNGDFDDIVFEGAELFVEIGIADWGQTNPTISYIPCGYFTPDVQPRSLTIVTLNALDRMMRFDQVAETSSAPWTTNLGANVTDNNGNIIYFVEGFSLPCNVATLVRQICDTCNVPFEQDLSSLPNYNYVVSALPTTNEDITYRSILQWCAGLMGTNAWIDWDGKLRFSWYNNTTDYSSTTATRYSSDLYEDAIEITGVQFIDTDEDKTVYLAGTNAYVLDMSNNGLVNSANAATILAAIYNVVHNFAYTPFIASVVAAPYLWPMDRVTFTDKHDVGHVSSLTNVNIVLNGGTVLKSAGETAQTAKGTSPSYFTSSQQRELEHIVGVTNTAMQDAVDHATEMITGGLGGYVILGVDEFTGQTEEILIMDNPDKNLAVNVWRFNQGGLGHSSNGYSGPFNDVALTADGKINANLITTGALDATLITTGTLDANLIRSGIISDYNGNNSWNLGTGAISMTSGSIDIGNFYVDSTGKLKCVGAEISGSLRTVNDPGYSGSTITVTDLRYGGLTLVAAPYSSYIHDDYDNIYSESNRAQIDIFLNSTPGYYGTDKYSGIKAINGTTLVLESNNSNEDAAITMGTTYVSVYGYSSWMTISSTGLINIISDGRLNLNSPIVDIAGSGNGGYIVLRGDVYSGGTSSGNKGITGGYWSWRWGSSWTTNQPVYLEFINGICVDAHY